MRIILAKPRGFCANTYILTADDKTAVVIDPAHAGIVNELTRYGLTCSYVLLTHCHFDHVDGVPALQKSGAKVVCSAVERALVGTQADLYELFGAPRNPYHVDQTFQDGERLSLSGITFQALITPGHTAGGACYITEENGEKCIFTGDTLFAGTIGRTDFPTGNGDALLESLKRLHALEGEYTVYPGHEEQTTLQKERRTNPFLRVF